MKGRNFDHIEGAFFGVLTAPRTPKNLDISGFFCNLPVKRKTHEYPQTQKGYMLLYVFVLRKPAPLDGGRAACYFPNRCSPDADKRKTPAGRTFSLLAIHVDPLEARTKPERMSTGRRRGGRNPYQLHRAEPAQSATRKNAKFKRGIDPQAGERSKEYFRNLHTAGRGRSCKPRESTRKHEQKKTATPNRQAGATAKPETQRRSISGNVILHDAGSRCKRERPAERNFS